MVNPSTVSVWMSPAWIVVSTISWLLSGSSSVLGLVTLAVLLMMSGPSGVTLSVTSTRCPFAISPMSHSTRADSGPPLEAHVTTAEPSAVLTTEFR